MSYKYKVGLMIKKENWKELKEKILTYGFEDEELITFRNPYVEDSFGKWMIVMWNYVKWDVDTSEPLEMVEDYLKMLKLNNIPFRFIKLGEFYGDIQETKVYGTDPKDIPTIESGISPFQAIKIGKIKIEDLM